MSERFIIDLADIVSNLSFAFENFLMAFEEYQKIKKAVASQEHGEVVYKMALKRMKEEIQKFQVQTKEIMSDYARIKSAGRPINFVQYLQKEVDKIVEVKKRIDKLIPKEALKSFLSPSEYRLFLYIGKITVEKIEAFYEVNYYLFDVSI